MSDHLAISQLAALVKAKRGKKGLRDTAKEIGDISPSTLSRIEQGKMPDLDTFLKLCEWLGISPSGFFESQNENKHPKEPTGLPLVPGMTTPEVIHAHLRADKELDPETAEALAEMVRVTYNAVVQGKLGRKR